MNEVKIFNNEEFGEVRTVIIDGEPWFVGRDVAIALGYGNGNKDSKSIAHAVANHVDEDDRRRVLSKDFQGDGNGYLDIASNYGIVIINESGLYSLIFGSQLPTAKKFKHWVTSEVLPSIRKTGSYSITEKQDSYMIEDPKKRAERWIEEYEEKRALEESYKKPNRKLDISIPWLTVNF